MTPPGTLIDVLNLPLEGIDAVLGLVVSSFCFGLAFHNIIGATWPEPFEKYRRLALAATFILISSWSAAGLSGVGKGFWSAVDLLIGVVVVGGTVWFFRSWFRNMPLPEQRYVLRGVGLVTVREVQGAGPDALVVYEDPDGLKRSVHAAYFMPQAELQALVVPNVERL